MTSHAHSRQMDAYYHQAADTTPSLDQPSQPGPATATFPPFQSGYNQVLPQSSLPVAFGQSLPVSQQGPLGNDFIPPNFANPFATQPIDPTLYEPFFPQYLCQALGDPDYGSWHPGVPSHLPLSNPVDPTATYFRGLDQLAEVRQSNQQLGPPNAIQAPFVRQPDTVPPTAHHTQPLVSHLAARPALGTILPFRGPLEVAWGFPMQEPAASHQAYMQPYNNITEPPIRYANEAQTTNTQLPPDVATQGTLRPIAPAPAPTTSIDNQALLPLIGQHPINQTSSIPLDPRIGSELVGTRQSHTIELSQLERARAHRKAIKRKAQDGVVRRGRFPDERTKEETRMTRKNKACIRCQSFRVRCIPDSDDPTSHCATCKVTPSSTIPCIRLRVTDISLFRLGPSENFVWSRRWLGKGLKEMSKWKSKDFKWIALTQDGNASIKVLVGKFAPRPKDVLSYRWTCLNENRSLDCAPYAMANINDVCLELQRHIRESTVQYVSAFTERKTQVLGRTFRMILSTIEEGQGQPEHVELLRDTLRLWVASRLIEKPWRVSGNETLEHDISDSGHPFWDSSSPYHDHIPVTPVMDNQLDQIVIKGIMQPLGRDVMKRFRGLIEANEMQNWFAIYLCTFLLLNNYEIATNHDRKFAIRHSLTTRFSNFPLLEGFHTGAKTLLAHFHYCCKGQAPFQLDWPHRRKIEPMRLVAALSIEQGKYMAEMKAMITAEGDEWKVLKESEAWESDVYFVSQMFDDRWKPTHTL